MYYAILLVLGAIILFVGWPRSAQKSSQFPLEVVEQRLEQLERSQAALEGRLAAIEKDLAGINLSSSTSAPPLSGKALASYNSIQRDWQDGSSLAELCRRYELLRGEVELILDLMGEGVQSNEPRHLYGVHRHGREQSRPGSEGREPC